jgi:DNA end-binding protein Ku
MRFDADMRLPKDLKLPAKKSPAKKELEMAMQLIEQMKTDFDPKKYKDTYQQKLKKIIKAKAEHKEFKPATPEHETPTAVKDLMSQLKESLKQNS